MVKRCAVQFCNNLNKTGHSTHTFPKDPNLRRQWIKFVQVKRADFVDANEHSVICGDHFSPDCFESEYMREMGFKKTRNLIPGSVPTIQTQRPAEIRKRPMELESKQPEVVVKSKKTPPESRALQKLEVSRISQKLV